MTPKEFHTWPILGAIIEQACAAIFAGETRPLDFTGADLSGVRLLGSDASFVGASFDRASFVGASFVGASFDRASFVGASFVGASFVGASFVGASFVGASFDRASFDRASFDRASFVGASFGRASFDRASFVGASFGRASFDRASFDRASFDRASFDDASFDRASFGRASFDRASFAPIREDLYRVLESRPHEVPGLLSALREGRVDGSTYEGPCACLVGTIANVAGCRFDSMPELRPDSSRLAEVWFLAFRPGTTPVNHPLARITEGWIVDWLEGRKAP